jgi:predicted transglutaminase-like cysteine proteinase
MHRKQLFFRAVCVAVLLSACNLAFSQDSASQQDKPSAGGRSAQSIGAQDPIDEDIKLLRKDLRSEKKQVVAANMNLTDAEAVKFWPVYDQYAADVAKINDTKAALIEDYWQTFETMNGDAAESYLRKRAAVEESLMQLRLKYIPIFGKVVSGRQTALFFQIDWRLSLMVDLQLARMPLIDP